MFITISEVIAIIAMIFGIGYIFSDFFRRPRHTGGEYDPLEHYKKSTGLWNRILYSSAIAAPTIVLHELAHKVVAMGFGAQTQLGVPYLMYAVVILLKMLKFPLLFFVGGYVSHTPLPALQSAAVAVAGPAMNLLLWGICVGLVRFKLVPHKYYQYLIPMGKLSMFLAIFNLIPFPGFDGYHFFTQLAAAFF